MAVRDVVQAAAGVGGGDKLYVEDVFSTYLYTGNSAGSSSTNVPNGIDLTGEGGLVWIKQRDTGTFSSFGHVLVDTERGNTKVLQSNTTGAEQTIPDAVSFNADGFTAGFSGYTNMVDDLYASWTFRKAPKFFDVVTYTGNGVAGREIPHSLDAVPGCIIVKNTTSQSSWVVYHQKLNNGTTPQNYFIELDGTGIEDTNSSVWNNTAPTSTAFTVGSSGSVNDSGQIYVAYLFASNAEGFGLSGTDSVIACGNYDGNGSTNGPEVTLDFEPQWLLIRRVSGGAGAAVIVDTMRGASLTGGNGLYPSYFSAENGEGATQSFVYPTATGFKIGSSGSYINSSSSKYIYIAIRRGPMKTPTSGTEVFAPVVQGFDGFVNTGFVTDLIFGDQFTGGNNWRWLDRLRGESKTLNSNNTNAEGTEAYWKFDYNTGVLLNAGGTIPNWIWYNFRRAPSVFDVVAYTGTGVARTVAHNLGVAPEMIIVKRRSGISFWMVYNSSLSNVEYLYLNATQGVLTGNNPWNGTSPTSEVITLGSDSNVNASGDPHIAYLFASLPGVSKVGSYTGTGTTQTINCGFSSGARFVLIKRTDSTGDWYVWDSVRGIVAGNDPYLLLNSTAAEVTSTDYIDPVASGFEISSLAPAAINASGGTFIYLAIA